MTKIDIGSVNEMKRQGGLLKHYFNETGGRNKKLTEKRLKEIQAIVKKIEKPFVDDDPDEVYQAKLAAIFDKNLTDE